MKTDINICRSSKCPHFDDGLTVRCKLVTMPNYPCLPELLKLREVPKGCQYQNKEK